MFDRMWCCYLRLLLDRAEGSQCRQTVIYDSFKPPGIDPDFEEGDGYNCETGSVKEANSGFRELPLS